MTGSSGQSVVVRRWCLRWVNLTEFLRPICVSGSPNQVETHNTADEAYLTCVPETSMWSTATGGSGEPRSKKESCPLGSVRTKLQGWGPTHGEIGL